MLLLGFRRFGLIVTIRPAPRLQPSVRPFTAMPPSLKQHRALLLLPPAPSPPSYAALKAAYSSPLFTVLKELARTPRRAQEPAILDIALPCPHLYGQIGAPRGPLYATTQSLVAGLYKLICVIAAKNAIDTEDAEGVDARVVPVAYPRDGKLESPIEDPIPDQELQGPAIHLRTLARSPRVWDTVYSVECEEGEGVLQNFVSFSASEANVKRVRGGIVQVETSEPAAATPQEAQAPTNHLSVAVGGTFDHLHIGHKLLLTMFAFVLGIKPSTNDQGSSTLTVGITGDALLKNKKYAEHLESWQERQQAVHNFLSSLIYFGQPEDSRIRVQELNDSGPNGHAVHVTYPWGLVVKYVEIWDPFGPTITDESISALVISLETRSGGDAVNSKRVEKGWSPLEVFEVAVLDAGEEEAVDETFQSKLSSTEIRRMRSERVKNDV
ncbi:pantetheine-phosphate adenylyltransferase family protein [Trematosphaeria pertusa]|uniref:Pantetheine-phosphate adenylyltransferase family protein n=1 Tax=Trematosphaeria pertusa TaxID=390896 RepID=A0A6A6IVU2_9PLEO|nr:pantetheine-phosphate adenylyltransferase family protein [Trematosphaeria pertusa]KAF2254685.1 pantetheine-phosphate adenylyltransferase family protein [Trematosphaeria pertusa]